MGAFVTLTADLRLGYLLLVAVLAIVIARALYDLWLHARLGPFARVLSSENKLWLEDLAHSLGDDRVILRGHAGAARALWREDAATARRRLRLACEHLEQAARPEMLRAVTLLRGMARSVRVLPPPRPLAVAAYRLARTRGLAAAAALLHWLGQTGHDRVRVRLWFLRRAFLAAARVFTRSARRLLAPRFEDPQPWPAVLDLALDDIGQVHDETVVTAEQILAAFSRWQQSQAG